MRKFIDDFEREKTIAVLQGLIFQNEVKENPRRIPLSDMHIEALETAVALLQRYQDVVRLSRKFMVTATDIQKTISFIGDDEENQDG